MWLHFMAGDVLYLELIDPDSGAVVDIEPGAKWELVLTHLLRDCQPLVRFRTGDIITIDEVAPCACGRTGFRFRVVGRSDDMVVVRGLNMFPSMVAAELARGQVAHPDLVARIEAELKKRLGASARVPLVLHGTFSRSEGKTKRVIQSHH